MKYKFSLSTILACVVIMAIIRTLNAIKSPNTLNIVLSVVCIIASLTMITCIILEIKTNKAQTNEKTKNIQG